MLSSPLQVSTASAVGQHNWWVVGGVHYLELIGCALLGNVGALHSERNPRVSSQPVQCMQSSTVLLFCSLLRNWRHNGSFKEAKSENAGSEEIQDSAQSS